VRRYKLSGENKARFAGGGDRATVASESALTNDPNPPTPNRDRDHRRRAPRPERARGRHYPWRAAGGSRHRGGGRRGDAGDVPLRGGGRGRDGRAAEEVLCEQVLIDEFSQKKEKKENSMRHKNARKLVARLSDEDKKIALRILIGLDVSSLPNAWCGIALIEILSGAEIMDLSIFSKQESLSGDQAIFRHGVHRSSPENNTH
jgi:hypothetical protein